MSNKTVLITGVSKGIGNKLVIEFLNRGFKVVGLSRSESISVEIKSNSNYHHHIYSIANLDALFEVLNPLIAEIGTVDFLINNAGMLINKPADQLSESDFQTSFQVNSVFPFQLVQGMLLRGFLTQGAHIVNVSSVGGVQGSKKYTGLLAYSASKAALIAISESMQEEWGDRLTVNVLALGSVATDMFYDAFSDAKPSLSDVDAARWISNFTIDSVNIMAGQLIQVKKSDPKQ